MSRYADEVLKKNGIDNYSHKARKISHNDYEKFDYILGMDLIHLNELQNTVEMLKCNSKIFLLGEFNAEISEKIINDPYDGDREVYENTYQQILQSCKGFLVKLLNSSV